MKKKSFAIIVACLLMSIFLLLLLYFIQVAFKYTLVFDELITYILFFVLILYTVVIINIYKTIYRKFKFLFICSYIIISFVFISSFIDFAGDSATRIFYDSPKGMNRIELIQITNSNSITIQGYKVKWRLFKIGDYKWATSFDEFILLDYKAIWKNENEVIIKILGRNKTKEFTIKF